jgi:hypothetical protein
VTGWRGPEWRQQVVEQRDRGVRVDSGALPEGFLPPGLESRGQILAHLLRGVGVQAAHSRDLVSKPLLGQDLGNAVSRATTRTPALSWCFLCSSGRSSVFADQALDDVGALNPGGHIDRLAGLVQRRYLFP